MGGEIHFFGQKSALMGYFKIFDNERMRPPLNLGAPTPAPRVEVSGFHQFDGLEVQK